VKPGAWIYLSGKFLELRPNHFHTGLDIVWRSGRRGDLCSRQWGSSIKIFLFRLRKCDLPQATLQVTSPLYGHLRNFTQKPSTYIRKKMYEAKSERPEVVSCSRWNSLLKRRQSPMAEYRFLGGPQLTLLKSETVGSRDDPYYWISKIKDRTPSYSSKKSPIVTTSYDLRSMENSAGKNLHLSFRARW